MESNLLYFPRVAWREYFKFVVNNFDSMLQKPKIISSLITNFQTSSSGNKFIYFTEFLKVSTCRASVEPLFWADLTAMTSWGVSQLKYLLKE